MLTIYLNRVVLLSIFCLIIAFHTMQAKPLNLFEAQKQEMFYAIQVGDISMVRHLIAIDNRLLEVWNEQGYTPLMYSAEQMQTAIVKLLVKKGANVNVTNVKRQSALHIAANGSCIHCIKILVKAGANLNKCDAFGKTPVDYATASEQKGIANYVQSQRLAINFYK